MSNSVASVRGIVIRDMVGEAPKEALADLATEVGHPLPNALGEILVAGNGGLLHYTYRVAYQGEHTLIGGFRLRALAAEQDRGPLSGAALHLRQIAEIPASWVLMMATPDGSSILVDCADPAGPVYGVLMDFIAESGKPWLIPLAADLASFLEGLVPDRKLLLILLESGELEEESELEAYVEYLNLLYPEWPENPDFAEAVYNARLDFE